MSQTELDREVSLATGESILRIQRQGFSGMPLPDDDFLDEPEVSCIRIIDWDEVEAFRRHAA